MYLSCSNKYWLIIFFVFISELSTIFFSIIDYYEIEFFRKYLINQIKQFPDKNDMKICLKANIESYKKIILPAFFISIFTCNTLNIRFFNCCEYNITHSISRILIHILASDYLFYIIL